MKVISRLCLFSVVLLFGLLPATTMAQMVLNDSIIHFSGSGGNRSDIEVFNSGKMPLYLHIKPYQIINPGTPEQQKVEIKNPKESGLLVSPQKMVVPPGGRKLVRFVNMNKDRGNEKIFRVLFEPVTGAVKSTQTGLKLLIGYEVLVLMQPSNPTPNLVAERNGKTLLLMNKGNTNIYLRDVKQCPSNPSDGNSACQPIQDKRLYPGNKWQLSLTEDWPVYLEMGVGEKRISRTIQ